MYQPPGGGVLNSKYPVPTNMAQLISRKIPVYFN